MNTTVYIKTEKEFIDSMLNLKDVCHLPTVEQMTVWYKLNKPVEILSWARYTYVVLLPKQPTKGYYNHFVDVYFLKETQYVVF